MLAKPPVSTTNEQLRVGSLFSGIGGFDLGFERAGMRSVWLCERDKFARFVLRKHWPDVPIYDDVRYLPLDEVPRVDLLCGGFPCQDISSAGAKEGIRGSRSSAWVYFHRAIRTLRPRYVVVENVGSLAVRGLDTVLGDLAEVGYDAEWDCLRASDFGAPHKRERLWIVAYAQRDRCGERHKRLEVQRRALYAEQVGVGGSSGTSADTDSIGLQSGRLVFGARGWAESAGLRRTLGQPWAIEPAVGRMAHGVPRGAYRLRALGNALVPQVAEWIGRRIVQLDAERPIHR
jgi:DNA (cytosine-5)-methyltransferase 1